MSSVGTMKSEDFEHEEKRPHPLYPGGRKVVVRVAKVGGGSTDRAYAGLWFYRVTHTGSSHVLVEGHDLNTGTPKTHRQVVDIVLDFLADELGRGDR